jgi:hypothetical protein
MKNPSVEVPRRAAERGEHRRDRGKERPVEKTIEVRRDRGDGCGEQSRGWVGIFVAGDTRHRSF